MVSIKKLNFSYKHDLLYEDFDIKFSTGHIYGLLGKNGAGKSTLLGLIAGTIFTKDGHIETLGYDPKHRKADMLSQIFYLPEQFLLPSLTCKEYLRLYCVFYPKFSSDDFKNYLSTFDVSSSEKLDSLSYGQQKKFLIAFGLATNSPLNIFDEPTNGLDIPSKTAFRKLIAAAASDEKTFIISTHQVKDIENLIDHICLIDNSKIALDYPVDTINTKLKVLNTEELDGSEIYFEDIGIGKYMTLTQDKNSDFSPVNLELLFNAALKSKDRLNKILKGV